MPPFLNPPFIIAMLIALSVHECAHGFVAFRLGDPTAKYAGRLTLNPVSHLDPLGTLMFLFVGFGWAKPVPVDPRYFKRVKRDTALVALAGPVSNLMLAWIAFVVLFALNADLSTSAMDLLSSGAGAGPVRVMFIQIAASSLFINLALMAFNLLPIAPLDGSKIIHPFIPLRFEDQYCELMQKGPYILLAVIILERLINFPLLSGWVFGIMSPVLWVMATLAGLLF